jgi:S1-C subfamily serine protease
LLAALALAFAAGGGCHRAPAPPQVDIYAHRGEPSLAEIQAAAAHGDAEAQNRLATLYFTGEGVAQDRALALLWWHQAARNGVGDAQASLGWVYFNGLGTPVDEVLAYAWSSLGADNGLERARANRDAIARRLDPEQLARARQLAAAWSAQFGRSGAGRRRLQKVGEGTVFLLNSDGGAVTARHVVGDCVQLRLRGRGGMASILASDVDNDLALLRVPGKVAAVATLASDPGALRQGDPVLVFGYPLTAWLSIGGNLTLGTVSAVSGLGNDPNQLQITAPIQPGSSGSPVLDQRGMVVGVVSMRLSDARMIEATGTSGQNLNFAVSGKRLNLFLRRHGAAFQTSSFFSMRRDNADIADEARQWTGVIECWK